MDSETRNILAVVASFFIPGLGQMIKGHIARGIGIMATYFVLTVLAFLLTFILIGLLLWPVVLIVWAYNVYDAYKLAPKAETPAVLHNCFLNK